MVCDVSVTNIDEHFQIFSGFRRKKAWLFHVSLLLGSYAGLIRQGGHMFLGGNPLGKSTLFRRDLRQFWERYKVVYHLQFPVMKGEEKQSHQSWW